MRHFIKTEAQDCVIRVKGVQSNRRRLACRARAFRRSLEQLETRALLASVLGQVVQDMDGDGLRDPGEAGQLGVTVALNRFDAATGEVTAFRTVITDESGDYRFDGVAPGLYQIGQQVPVSMVQTSPVAEHTPRSFLIQVATDADVIGTQIPLLTPPVEGWLANLPAASYTFPVQGDFLFHFGPEGLAPACVFFTGQARVVTEPATTTTVPGEEGSLSLAQVQATMTELVLYGTIKMDQHDQGYIGPITLRLSGPATGTITQRRDNPLLADSAFALPIEVVIPGAFGVATVLKSAAPIMFEAVEIGRFPAIGSTFTYRGKQPPAELVDAQGQAGGKIFFAGLSPMAGMDFSNFVQATIAGTAYIDVNGDRLYNEGDVALAGQKITIAQSAEIPGPDSEGGGGGGGGEHETTAAPPSDDHGPGTHGGHAGITYIVTTGTDGTYRLDGLNPGTYTVTRSETAWTLVVPASGEYVLDPILSGSTNTLDFVYAPAEGLVNTSTALGYDVATHAIVPNLLLGSTILANDPSKPYPHDGATIGTAVPGWTVPMTVTVVGPAAGSYLSAWIDFHGNQSFADGGDAVLLDAPILPGTHTFNVTIPESLAVPAGGLVTYVRLRLSTASGLGPAGPASDGEVEDIPITIYGVNDLGRVRGQTFHDLDGDAVRDPAESGENGWKIDLIDLKTGATVVSTISASLDLNGDAVIAPYEIGIYELAAVPGTYEIRATPPDAGWTVNWPVSEEGAVAYRFQLDAGETIGLMPVAIAPVSSDSVAQIPVGRTDTMTVLGEFMILKSGGGGGGETGESQMIRITLLGPISINWGELITAVSRGFSVSDLTLQGLAVKESEGAAPVVLGPVSVKLFAASGGSLGPRGRDHATGEGEGEDTTEEPAAEEETSLGAHLDLWVEFDLSAFGMGTMRNSTPLALKGGVSQLPMIGVALTRRGTGQPVTITSMDGTKTARVLQMSLTTMSGLDESGYVGASLGGAVHEDADGDNVRDPEDGPMAGTAIMVTMAPSEEGPTGDHGQKGEHGGPPEGKGGEEEPAPVYVTRTDATGAWSLTGLSPGTYVVTVTLPPGYGNSAGATFSYSVTLQSQGAIGSLDFLLYPINDPPALSMLATLVASEDTVVVFSAATGNPILVSDPDAAAAPLKLIVTASQGTMTLGTTSGLTFLSGDGTDDSTMTFTGSLADLNAALEGLRYMPLTDVAGSVTIDVTVDDQGNTGLGGAKSVRQSIALTINAVADAPTLTVTDASGAEGRAFPLPIAASLIDATGETLALRVDGVPSGATLSAGTNLGGGSWRLTPDQIAGLTITLPDNGSYTLQVTAMATETSNASEARTAKAIAVSVANVSPALGNVLDQEGTLGQAVDFILGSLDDVAGDGPWQLAVDWGDSTKSSVARGQTGPLGTLAHAYEHNGRYEAVVTVTDKDGGAAIRRFVVNVSPAVIQSLLIGDGTRQRSQIQAITTTFSGLVVVEPGALVLRNKSGRLIPTTLKTSVVDGHTVATLTFPARVRRAGSLGDDSYILVIRGDRVVDPSNGRHVDAAGGKGPHSQRTVHLRRLFGDVNGDGRVTAKEMRMFESAFGHRKGEAEYLALFDIDGNGRIGMPDRVAMMRRLQY